MPDAPQTPPIKQYEYLTEYIQRTYTEARLYQREGVSHPVVFYPADEQQRDDVDSVLGASPTQILDRDAFPVYDYGYLHTLQNSSATLFNGVTFAMRLLRTRPLQLEASFGTYFDMIATCAALERETRDAAYKRAIRSLLRRSFHQEITTDRVLTHGDGRSAAIGCACLLVFNKAGTYHAVLSKRTSKHATRPNAYHLLPAFIFQPMGKTPQDMQAQEWSLRHHIYREFLEELFAMPEDAQGSFYDHPALRDLQAMEARGEASIHLTGIAMNLLTLRPEFNTLLLIRDAGWWERVQAADSAFPLDVSAETSEELILLPLERDPFQQALPPHVYVNMPPQAIPALWEGAELARYLLQQKG